jgi:PAS domain S-box-containing protein
MHKANPELTAEVMSAMLAASPDCVKILSADGEILYINAGGAELMQLDSVSDFIGVHYLDLWLAHDRERIASAVKQAAAGETVRFEACCHNARNELKCWEVSLAPFHTEGLPARVVGISRDISEHRQSKIALSVSESERQEAERRHQALSELSTRLFDLDDTSDLAYASAEILGRTLNISRAGYGTIDPVAETITIERDWNAPGIQTLAGKLHFRDCGTYIEDLKRGETVVFADAYNDPRTAQYADKLKSISAQSAVNMPITEHGGFVAIIYTNHESAREWTNAELIFMRDVANRTRVAIERRRAQEELRAVAASLQQQVAARTIERDRIWRLSIDLILIAQMDAHIVAANPAWTRILGWDNDELVGSNLLDLIHPDDIEHTVNEIARLSEGQIGTALENRYRRRDGSYCWISWNAFPNDGLIHAFGRDVGREKEHAHALALAQ